MNVMEIAPVVKTLELRRSASDAFRIYVHEAARWWPFDTHALSPENNTKAIGHVVEASVGGRVYEVADDGREFEWGQVLAYEPGRRFSMTWQLGRAHEKSGEVEVVFEPTGPDSCRVTLTHSHWERMGAEGVKLREGYNNGWESVFGQRFADYARNG